MKNSDEKLGYMPIYYGYGDQDKVEQWFDLKDFFSLSDQNTIFFVKIHYTFEKIGSMVAEEDIEKIGVDSIEKIIFLSWQKDFTGAGPLNQLPLKTIQKLKAKPILHVKIAMENVSDKIFINQNPNVSEHEFNLLIKYSPTEARKDEFYTLYHLIVYPQNYKIQYGDLPSLDEVINSLKQSIEYVEKQIKDLSHSYTNSYINNYFLQIKTKYEKRMKIYKAILSYLKENDTKKIVDFADNEINDKDTKERIYSIIKESTDEENGLSRAKEVLNPLYKLLSFIDEDKLFNKVLEEIEIIVFIRHYD